MTAQLGFLEPLEWTEETQNDFSMSRLGGLPVHFTLLRDLVLTLRWLDMADRQSPSSKRCALPDLFPSIATTNTTLRSYR